MQGFNKELVKCFEEFCSKRHELHRIILDDEEEKKKIQNDIKILNERLTTINESLSKNIATRDELDRLIEETESSYTKIVDTSQNLLKVVKRKSQGLGKNLASGSPSSKK